MLMINPYSTKHTIYKLSSTIYCRKDPTFMKIFSSSNKFKVSGDDLPPNSKPICFSK